MENLGEQKYPLILGTKIKIRYNVRDQKLIYYQLNSSNS
jgi:hypothetical protein